MVEFSSFSFRCQKGPARLGMGNRDQTCRTVPRPIRRHYIPIRRRTLKNTKQLGTYKLENNKLTILLGKPGGTEKDRPKELAAPMERDPLKLSD
jgi:hypothetical protein